MRIGTMFLGRVDALDDESIQTKFLVIGVPLIPLSSHYVVRDHGTDIRGIEIPLHGKSVLLGYLRVTCWLVALVCGVFWLGIGDRSCMPWAIVFGIGMIVTTWGLGGLSRAEKTRRTLLKAVTGCGAPPLLLGANTPDLADKLRAQWEGAHEGQAWDRAIELGAADPMLFVVAEYHGRPDLAQVVLARLGAAPELLVTDGPYR